MKLHENQISSDKKFVTIYKITFIKLRVHTDLKEDGKIKINGNVVNAKKSKRY